MSGFVRPEPETAPAPAGYFNPSYQQSNPQAYAEYQQYVAQWQQHIEYMRQHHPEQPIAIPYWVPRPGEPPHGAPIGHPHPHMQGYYYVPYPGYPGHPGHPGHPQPHHLTAMPTQIPPTYEPRPGSPDIPPPPKKPKMEEIPPPPPRSLRRVDKSPIPPPPPPKKLPSPSPQEKEKLRKEREQAKYEQKKKAHQEKEKKKKFDEMIEQQNIMAMLPPEQFGDMWNTKDYGYAAEGIMRIFFKNSKLEKHEFKAVLKAVAEAGKTHRLDRSEMKAFILSGVLFYRTPRDWRTADVFTIDLENKPPTPQLYMKDGMILQKPGTEPVAPPKSPHPDRVIKKARRRGDNGSPQDSPSKESLSKLVPADRDEGHFYETYIKAANSPAMQDNYPPPVAARSVKTRKPKPEPPCPEISSDEEAGPALPAPEARASDAPGNEAPVDESEQNAPRSGGDVPSGEASGGGSSGSSGPSGNGGSGCGGGGSSSGSSGNGSPGDGSPGRGPPRDASSAPAPDSTVGENGEETHITYPQIRSLPIVGNHISDEERYLFWKKVLNAYAGEGRFFGQVGTEMPLMHDEVGFLTEWGRIVTYNEFPAVIRNEIAEENALVVARVNAQLDAIEEAGRSRRQAERDAEEMRQIRARRPVAPIELVQEGFFALRQEQAVVKFGERIDAIHDAERAAGAEADEAARDARDGELARRVEEAQAVEAAQEARAIEAVEAAEAAEAVRAVEAAEVAEAAAAMEEADAAEAREIAAVIAVYDGTSGVPEQTREETPEKFPYEYESDDDQAGPSGLVYPLNYDLPGPAPPPEASPLFQSPEYVGPSYLDSPVLTPSPRATPDIPADPSHGGDDDKGAEEEEAVQAVDDEVRNFPGPRRGPPRTPPPNGFSFLMNRMQFVANGPLLMPAVPVALLYKPEGDAELPRDPQPAVLKNSESPASTEDSPSYSGHPVLLTTDDSDNEERADNENRPRRPHPSDAPAVPAVPGPSASSNHTARVVPKPRNMSSVNSIRVPDRRNPPAGPSNAPAASPPSRAAHLRNEPRSPRPEPRAESPPSRFAHLRDEPRSPPSRFAHLRNEPRSPARAPSRHEPRGLRNQENRGRDRQRERSQREVRRSSTDRGRRSEARALNIIQKEEQERMRVLIEQQRQRNLARDAQEAARRAGRPDRDRSPRPDRPREDRHREDRNREDRQREDRHREERHREDRPREERNREDRNREDRNRENRQRENRHREDRHREDRRRSPRPARDGQRREENRLRPNIIAPAAGDRDRHHRQ